MTDTEFISEMRRGLLLIMGALIKRYGLSWAELLPRAVTRPAPAPDYSTATVTPAPEFRG